MAPIERRDALNRRTHEKAATEGEKRRSQRRKETVIVTDPTGRSRIISAVKELFRKGKLVPICANCGAVRLGSQKQGKFFGTNMSKRGWSFTLEKIKENDTENKGSISHSICPRCVTELYPDIKMEEL